MKAKEIEKIQKELEEKIKIIKEYDDFILFKCEDGTMMSANLTKTGRYKKNSIRLWLF